MAKKTTKPQDPVSETKTFNIKRHNLTLWQKWVASTGVAIQGCLQCYGPSNEEFVVYALHSSNTVPTPPICDMAGNIAYLYVPFADFHEYVELVRSEKNVQANFDSVDPSRMNLYSYQL